MRKKRQVPISKEVEILRFMRQSRRLSYREAAERIGVHLTAILHIEKGRMALPPERVEKMVRSYGYSMAEFQDYLAGRKSPIDHLQECQTILENLPLEQLRIVHGILRQFSPQQ